MCAISVTHMMFVTASWLPHFISHTVIFYVSLIGIMSYRGIIGDDAPLMTNFLVASASFLMLDLTVYLNMRAKARLFFKLQVIEQQEQQLAALLDALPDSVFICSKP